MEVEGAHALEQTQLVEIPARVERRDLRGAFDDRRTEPELIEHRHVETLHQRARVLPEALLARHEFVAVVAIFHLSLLRVAREADIVVWGKQQACTRAFEPLANRLDFGRLGFLFGNEVVQAKY